MEACQTQNRPDGEEANHELDDGCWCLFYSNEEIACLCHFWSTIFFFNFINQKRTKKEEKCEER